MESTIVHNNYLIKSQLVFSVWYLPYSATCSRFPDRSLSNSCLLRLFTSASLVSRSSIKPRLCCIIDSSFILLLKQEAYFRWFQEVRIVYMRMRIAVCMSTRPVSCALLVYQKHPLSLIHESWHDSSTMAKVILKLTVRLICIGIW